MEERENNRYGTEHSGNSLAMFAIACRPQAGFSAIRRIAMTKRLC
jgi:hypothetical protein